MKLGQQVLYKIQNILSEIDKKKTPRKKYPIVQQQQNIDVNPVFEKLHDHHKIQQLKMASKLQQRINDQQERLSPFKITNKHTIFINAQKQQPPLHQRLQQEHQKKMEKLYRLREKYPTKQDMERDEQNQIIKYLDQRAKNQKKYTREEADLKVTELLRKEKERMQRLNRLKIQVIDEHSKDFRCKPYINQKSQKLWNKRMLKKQLSTSVFERFNQYQIYRKYHLQQTEKIIKSRVTPFAPLISQTSRLLASRSKSKSDLQKPLERSLSCKCLQRSKSRKHNGSTAMHTSRKI